MSGLELCAMPLPQFDLLHILQVKASAANVEPDQTLEISEQEVAERRRENMKAILRAYRFTGIIYFLTCFSSNLLFLVSWFARYITDPGLISWAWVFAFLNIAYKAGILSVGILT